MLPSNYPDAENAKHVGLTVYHIDGGACPPIFSGLYVWSGTEWLSLWNSGTGVSPCTPGEVMRMTDPRDKEEYYIGNFDDAGVWMLENLRYVPTAADYMHNPATSNDNKYYAYPREVSGTTPYSDLTGIESTWKGSENLRRMGILYNWAGATDGKNGSKGNQSNAIYDTNYEKIQGVCPTGWHLPSDMEWSDLEEEIAATAGIYSTDGTVSLPSNFRTTDGYRNTTHGKKMKSTTRVFSTVSDPEGTSNLASAGGFDALLVGNVTNDISGNFGEQTLFWSSSSGNGTNAWARGLDRSNEGVNRYFGNRSIQFSVRCKRD
jgi:uncharacterized protein (TIGR02145 family)